MTRLLLKRAAGEFGGSAGASRGGFIAAVQSDKLRTAPDAKVSRSDLIVGGTWNVTPSVTLGGLLASSHGDIAGT